jgi:hypothetical protein
MGGLHGSLSFTDGADFPQALPVAVKIDIADYSNRK